MSAYAFAHGKKTLKYNYMSKIWKSYMKTKAAGGDPIDHPGALAVYLATQDAAWANGRVISAKWDPWRTLGTHRQEIQNSDLFTLRRIVPKDRGLTWNP